MGMSTEKRKEEGRSSTTMSGIGEGEGAQWCKGTAPKGRQYAWRGGPCQEKW